LKAPCNTPYGVPHRELIRSLIETRIGFYEAWDGVYKVRDGEFLEFLRITGINEVYIESAPREWIYRLLQNGVQVYILRRKNQNSLRDRYNFRKSHENDARLLYLIYRDNPSYFRGYVKRVSRG
jgi:hypothetical protein